MKKVINKGYTITVTSWENDADYYNTKSITVDTKEEAKAWYNMMQLCVSKNNKPEGIVKLGNTRESFSKEQKNLMISFLKENPILTNGFIEDDDEDTYIDYFYNLSYKLLGGSDYFAMRVMESITITYSPENVYCEEIIF